MMQEMWNGPPGFKPAKSASAPCSPAKPLPVSRTQSESFHVTHKVPVGDTPYVRAKHVQLVDKDPEKAIPLFWAAINAGDRVDSALKDMAIVMKQQNRADEAIEAIKSLRSRCSDQAQESLDNILLDLYKRCGRLDDQISLLRHKLYLIQQGLAFNGKRTKTARSQGKKFQVSVEQEATRLLGNLGWALMQQSNYKEAEDAYRRALSISPDNNKMCNLGICLMKQGRITEAKETLRRVKRAVADGPRGMDSHLKAYERAQQMLADLESELMKKAGDSVLEQSRLFNTFLGSSSIWQPHPCRENFTPLPNTKPHDDFHDENANSNVLPSKISSMNTQKLPSKPMMGNFLPIWQSHPCRENFSSLPNTKPQDEFHDENANSNILPSKIISINTRNLPSKPMSGGFLPHGNSLNIAAPPFYSTKFTREPNNQQLNETLKRTRSESATTLENKILRRSFEESQEKTTDFLPDDKDLEQAMISAVLSAVDTDNQELETAKSKIIKVETKGSIAVEKRLKVFRDITLSLSPKA